jgi:hypothetical protein
MNFKKLLEVPDNEPKLPEVLDYDRDPYSLITSMIPKFEVESSDS